MGYQLIAITTDRPSQMRTTIDENDLSYEVLSDSAMTAAAAFGIAYKLSSDTVVLYKGYGVDLAASSGMSHGVLPVPAVFIVGTDGVIKFQYVNPDYSNRLSGDVLRSAAGAAMEQMQESAKKSN